MDPAVKVLVVLLSVVFITCAAEKITLSEQQQNLFKTRCRRLAARLDDTDARCDRGLAALLNVERSKQTANFFPLFDALGFAVPGFTGNVYYPLFWSALDGVVGFEDDRGLPYNPYTDILAQNADDLVIWSSFNILPGALFNSENFNIIPLFLVDTFWKQYSEWMARSTVADVPSLWMAGGTNDGYLPKPPDGRFPSFFQLYELPNIESNRIVIFHIPRKSVAGKECSTDRESYQRLLDTNRRTQYTCCELQPLIGPSVDTSNGLPRPTVDYGRDRIRDMRNILSRIGTTLPGNCIDLRERFRQDELADDVAGAVGGIVDEAGGALLFGMYRRKRQLPSLLSSAVCTYLRTMLEGIAGEGRLDFSEEGDKLIGMRADGMIVRFTELIPNALRLEALNGLFLNSITYDCSSMELAISTQVDSFTIIPNILELTQVVLSFAATLGPTKEDLSLHTLEISAQWSVGGIAGQFEIIDDLDNSQLLIRGGPPGDGDVDLGALIEDLAGEDILGSSYTLSNVQVQAVVNMIEGGAITVAISGSFEQNTLYGIFQKRRDNSNAPYSAAFAADIDGVGFSELVDSLTGVDISSVPVIGSLSIPEIGITISTDNIHSPILMDIFSSESLLHIGGSYIGSGLTAYFKLVTDQGDVPVLISYSNKDFNFQFPSGFVLSFRSLLNLVPDLRTILDTVTLPPGIDNLLDVEINDFSVDTESGTVSIDATYPDTLTFFDQLTIDNLNVVINAVLKSPRSITVEFSGKIGIAGEFFDVDFSRNGETGGYVLDVTIVAPPSLNDLLSVIPELGSIELPPGISGLLSLEVNSLSADFSTGELELVVAYPGTLSILNDLLTVEEITLIVNAVVRRPRRVSITVSGQIGIGGLVSEIVFSRNAETGKYGIDATIDGDVTLNSLVSLIPELTSLPLPPGVSNVLNLKIDDFSADLDTLEMSVDAEYPGSLSFFDNAVVVRNPGVIIHAILRSPRSVSLEIVGDIEISGQDYSISITRDSNSGKYVLVADIGQIDIGDIVRQLGAAIVPRELNSIAEAAGFLQFAIDDAHITYPFGGQPQQIQISGQPEIAGFTAPRMSALVVRQRGKNQLVQGFEIGSIVISDLIKQISGFGVRSIAILNQELEAAVLISPVTLPGVRLIGSKLSDFSINKGVSFQAAMQWPPDCSDDAFCAVAQAALGPDARFVLGGTITDASSFTFTAAVSDLNLGSILLAEAGLEVSVGRQVEVGIFGSVEIRSPALVLTGAIRVGTRGVVLEMTMTGCWERAFGLDWLTICSLQVSVALKPGIPLAGFAFGGEVRLGDPSCGNQIQAQGFIGIDPVSPPENYYYVNIPGAFTIGSVLQALCVNVNLPKPVRDSGFPKGFLSSFSLLGKELPHVPLSISQGFRLKGTINILGLEASADVTLSLPNGLKMDVSLPVLRLSGNLLSMYASSNDRSRGPYLIVNITLLPRPSVNVEASGYLSVLGISREAILRITDDKYIFSTEGRFLNLFESSLEITASYGNIKSASFRVRGEFKNDLSSRIVDQVKSALQEAGNEATAKIDSAQRKVDGAKDKFDDANRVLSSAQREVNNAQAKFDSAVRTLRNAQERVRRLCTPRNCGSVCVPGSCGTTCKKRKWGRCIIRIPKFSACCTRIPDAACETERGLCIAARKSASEALALAERAVNSARITLDAAKLTLEGAMRAVNTARDSLNVANLALEAARRTYRAGAEAATALTRFAANANDLFSIRTITFDVTLSAASGGSFSGRVSARIFGRNVNVALNINLRNIASMARQLAEEAIDGLSSFIG